MQSLRILVQVKAICIFLFLHAVKTPPQPPEEIIPGYIKRRFDIVVDECGRQIEVITKSISIKSGLVLTVINKKKVRDRKHTCYQYSIKYLFEHVRSAWHIRRHLAFFSHSITIYNKQVETITNRQRIPNFGIQVL